MSTLDDETVIVLGFALGAVALLVLVFVWVVVYCLCCRENSRSKSVPSGQLLYYHNSSRPSEQSNMSRLGELPELPFTDPESPPLPPGHPRTHHNRASYTNAAYESTYAEPIYSYCDSPNYQAPVPHDSHAYEGMAITKTETSNNLKVQYTGDQHTLQRGMVEIPRVVHCTTNAVTEDYVDIMQPKTLEDDQSDEGSNENISILETMSTRVISVHEKEGFDAVDADESKDDNAESKVECRDSQLNILPIDNDVYFQESESDIISNVSSLDDDDEYKDPCALLDTLTIGEDNPSNNIVEEDKAGQASNHELTLDVDDMDEIADRDYYNFAVSDLSLAKEYILRQAISMQDNDLYELTREDDTCDNNSLVSNKGIIDVAIDNPDVLSEELTREEKNVNKVIPTPKPRKLTTSTCQLDSDDGNSAESPARGSPVPEPMPRPNKTPTNPPPYDQIVDYGQS